MSLCGGILPGAASSGSRAPFDRRSRYAPLRVRNSPKGDIVAQHRRQPRRATDWHMHRAQLHPADVRRSRPPRISMSRLFQERRARKSSRRAKDASWPARGREVCGSDAAAAPTIVSASDEGVLTGDDNHIAAAGSVRAAIEGAEESRRITLRIEDRMRDARAGVEEARDASMPTSHHARQHEP